MALDVMKQKVKSLWISIGSIDSKISEEDLVSLRSKVEEKDFVCPRFEYCLRNSRAITQFVMENKSYADPRYSTLAKELKLQNNVNNKLAYPFVAFLRPFETESCFRPKQHPKPKSKFFQFNRNSKRVHHLSPLCFYTSNF